MRTAIYVPFPQAVPNKPVIDRVHCTHFRTGKCGVCEKVCPTDAIHFDQQDHIISEEVGAIVVTTGFNVLNTDFFPEYGYGKYKDGSIQSLKIQITASVKSYTELIYVVETVADQMDNHFSGFDSYAVINDQDGLKAVVIKNAGKDAQSTLLY